MDLQANRDDSPIRPVDQLVLDLLRREEGLTIQDLMDRLEVTATAVRQRVDRLEQSGYVERKKQGVGRGRPSFCYFLTDQGWRQAGVTYSDLAISLWGVLQGIEDHELKSRLIDRVAMRMGESFKTLLPNAPLSEKMQVLSRLLSNRKVPTRLLDTTGLPILEVHACPYPDLVAHGSDRSVCQLEEQMLSDALGHPVSLSQCRLDGHACCQFSPLQSPSASRSASQIESLATS